MQLQSLGIDLFLGEYNKAMTYVTLVLPSRLKKAASLEVTNNRV